MKDFEGVGIRGETDKVERPVSDVRRMVDDFPEEWRQELHVLPEHVLETIDRTLEDNGEFLASVPNMLHMPEVTEILREITRANEGFEKLAVQLAQAMKLEESEAA